MHLRFIQCLGCALQAARDEEVLRELLAVEAQDRLNGEFAKRASLPNPSKGPLGAESGFDGFDDGGQALGSGVTLGFSARGGGQSKDPGSSAAEDVSAAQAPMRLVVQEHGGLERTLSLSFVDREAVVGHRVELNQLHGPSHTLNGQRGLVVAVKERGSAAVFSVELDGGLPGYPAGSCFEAEGRHLRVVNRRHRPMRWAAEALWKCADAACVCRAALLYQSSTIPCNRWTRSRTRRTRGPGRRS